MKSPSLDSLYYDLDKHIALVQAYTEIDYLDFLIRVCRLKPYSYVFEDRDKKLVLHRRWFDEYGHSLYITDDKKIDIVYYDLFLQKEKIICTDLYYGLPLDKLLRMSKIGYFDFSSQHVMCALLGIDNYLRCYWRSEKGWRHISPLVLGTRALRAIKEWSPNNEFQKLPIKENQPIPCISSRQWLTSLPMSQEFLALMNQQCEMVGSLLTQRDNNI